MIGIGRLEKPSRVAAGLPDVPRGIWLFSRAVSGGFPLAGSFVPARALTLSIAITPRFGDHPEHLAYKENDFFDFHWTPFVSCEAASSRRSDRNWPISMAQLLLD